MINEKYNQFLKSVSEKVLEFEWAELPREWVKYIDLPDYEAGDLRDIYYYDVKSGGLHVAAGAYLTRFYHDEDSYSTSKEYFISFFLINGGSMKGINSISSDEYRIYRRKNSPVAILGSGPAKDIIKEIYENAKNQAFDIFNLLDGLLEDENTK